ncbi:hypothetical protein [Salinibacterium sp. ZJ454]|nr:hypothetical protein [Salinibacterium sp. ZJ454]
MSIGRVGGCTFVASGRALFAASARPLIVAGRAEFGGSGGRNPLK